MKWAQKTLAVCSAALICSGALAQHPKLTQGDLSPLKTETSVNTQFTYDNMKVGKEDEAEYVKKTTEKYNDKQAGKGDTWAKDWVDDRRDKFEPQFNGEFTKYSDKTIDPKAKYTLIVHTYYTEPGFNIGFVRHNSEISVDVTVVESANPSHVIAKISIEKAPGAAIFENDFDTSQRIMAAYAQAGRVCGVFIKRS